MIGSEAAAWRLLKDISDEYQAVLGEKLVGVYAHGSLVFGCFHWAVSDIDFLVVVEEEPTAYQKEQLIRALLERTVEAPQKGFEMSVVCQEHLNPFAYPTPFCLHFSNTHLEACRKDLSGYCRRMRGTDRDLAAHCMVTHGKGRAVAGKPISDVFGEVPREAYLDSIRMDVEDARNEMQTNPVYMALNLCRVLAAVRDDLVLSKKEGGEWACSHIDNQWLGLIGKAIDAYSNGVAFEANADQKCGFAEYMLDEIAGFDVKRSNP